jgi:hypothetical protein
MVTPTYIGQGSVEHREDLLVKQKVTTRRVPSATRPNKTGDASANHAARRVRRWLNATFPPELREMVLIAFACATRTRS